MKQNKDGSMEKKIPRVPVFRLFSYNSIEGVGRINGISKKKFEQ